MPNMKLTPFSIHSIQPNRPEDLFDLNMMEVPDLIEETGEKGKGIVVAVLDTGVDRDHRDLKDRIVYGANFTKEGKFHNFDDENGHGTHVAGIITKTAPEVDLLICKVLDSKGVGSYDSIIHGILYASNWRGKHGERVRVINLSLGGPMNDIRLQKAILKACAEGIIVISAAGNEGDNDDTTFEYAFPSSYNECVTVAACDYNGKLAGFSNEHLEIDVIAPGVEILSTYLNNSYAILSGTSMATPFISGVMALIIKVGEKEFRRTLTESEEYSLLVKCCCSLGYKKSSEGNGLPKLSKLMAECSR